MKFLGLTRLFNEIDSVAERTVKLLVSDLEHLEMMEVSIHSAAKEWLKSERRYRWRSCSHECFNFDGLKVNMLPYVDCRDSSVADS